MSVSLQHAREVLASADLLHSPQQVATGLDRMAMEITARLGEAEPIVLCVLTGGIIPAGHLLTRLKFPLQLDYLHASRYLGETAGGELQWLARPTLPMAGRAVLVVDDILDEGLTLAAILEYCRGQGAAEVLSAVLVEKRHDRCVENLHADFTGLEVEDRYVFGCGMDYKGYFRNLDGIYAVANS